MAGGRRGKGVEIRRPREQNDKSQKKVELPHSLGRATMKNYPNSACFEKFLKEWKQHLPEANLEPAPPQVTRSRVLARSSRDGRLIYPARSLSSNLEAWQSETTN